MNTESHLIIQQIILPAKNDFMSKNMLAKELDVSVDTIEKWMRDNTFKYDIHYFQKDRVLRFYYPAIKTLFIKND